MENLMKLNQNMFSTLTSLKLYNIIIDIKTSIYQYEKFVKIRYLKIDGCNMRNLYFNEFLTLFPNCETLHCSHYLICSHDFVYQTNLKCLKLNGTKTPWMKTNRELSNVQNLNSLKFLKKFSNLVVLSLKFYENIQIEEETFRNLKKLKALTIDAIHIYFFGDWFRYLTNLKELKLLSSNLDIDILSKISFLNKLEKLEINLNCNKIKVLQKNSFKHLNLLKSLCLRFNEIRKIDENAFYGLEKLTKLRMINSGPKTNRLCLKSNVFKGLSSLKNLSLKEFAFNKVSNDLFDNVKTLLHLEILGNQGFKITKKTFYNLRDLNKLIFEQNELTYLEENVFLNLNKLVKLSLFKNRLKMLNENSFNGLSNLKVLNLNQNNLPVSLKFEILPKMPKLKLLLVYDQYCNLFYKYVRENVHVLILLALLLLLPLFCFFMIPILIILKIFE